MDNLGKRDVNNEAQENTKTTLKAFPKKAFEEDGFFFDVYITPDLCTLSICKIV